MTPGLTSIVIPTFNHAAYLPDAIDSALAQTAMVEVIAVDDGSTDGTAQIMERCRDLRVRLIHIEHAGPAAARNVGVEAAEGEFVMFLDADDVIAPNKIATQLWEMYDPEIGWALCDVRIESVDGKVEFASQRYHYARKEVGGWIAPLLEVANFIPVHSPLIRMSALDGVRFPVDRTTEDWHFWYGLACVARCRYVNQVLATYRKRPGGRNTSSTRLQQVRPGAVYPLRLNLGCGDRSNESWHPIPGFVNMDKTLGWRFEDGLRDFADGSVSGITISHALMFVRESDWPKAFAEFARVLKPGGVVRITEDDTAAPKSRTYRTGWRGSQPAITLTSAAETRRNLEAVGFTAYDVNAFETHYADGSLRQTHHGAPPDVFFIEGVKA